MALTKISNEVIEQNLENYLKKGLKAGSALGDLEISTYADAAGVNPVDGIGGSAGITASLNTSSPLSGDADLRIVKDASNRQGNGISIPFTIENRHLGKVLQISFDAELISGNYESPIITPTAGTYTITSTTVCTVTASHSFVAGQIVNMTFIGGTRPVDGFYTIVSVTATAFVITVSSGSATNATCSYTVPADLRVSIIQSPTGTPVVLEPVNTGIQLGIANQRIRHIASFQTHISITSYRLCIHVSNASTVAYTVDFANFRVWEPTQSIGAVITDWVDWVNPTASLVNFGSATISTARFRRVGSDLEFFIRGVSGVASGNSGINLPNGLVANTTSSSTINVGIYTRGISTALSTGFLLATNGSAFLLLGGYINGSSQNDTLSNGGTVFSNTNPFTLQASVPIAGWGSNVAMSSDSGDGRVVSASYRNITSSSISPIIFTIREHDTHNSYNTTTGIYTVPISGIYNISVAGLGNSSVASASVSVFKNNVYAEVTIAQQPNELNYRVSGQHTLNCVAGDTIELRYSGGATTIRLDSTFSIFRISAGSQIIASVEGVACSYYATSNTPQTSPTVTLKLPVRIYDTHGAWGTATGQFTAPMSGKYRVTLIGSSGGGQPVRLYKQNTSYFWIGNVENSTGTFTTSCDVDLLAGNVIDIRTSNGPSIATAWGGGTLGDNSVTVISISRIGT
jgi:hypothetical protein